MHKKKTLFTPLSFFLILLLFGCSGVDKNISDSPREIKLGQGETKMLFRGGTLYRRSGFPLQLEVTGSHYEMGFQYGVLLEKELIEMQELWEQLITFFANDTGIPRWICVLFVNAKIGKLSKRVPERFLKEVQGISAGSGVDYRIICGFSLFDEFTRTMSGCTSLILKTEKGEVIHGRNEDTSFGLVLAERSVLIKYRPENYLSYTIVTYPGVIGVSTGYNSTLGYSHNSLFSPGKNLKNGVTQHTLPRLALEEATTLAEVEKIYRQYSATVSDAHIWSDRKTKRGTVIETAPSYVPFYKKRELTGSTLWQQNQYIDKEYRENVEDSYLARRGMFKSRKELLTDYLDKNRLQHSIEGMIDFLAQDSDNEGINRNFYPFANGINNYYTVNSIIFDPAGEGIYWARDKYYAARSTFFFIPDDFSISPEVYKEEVPLDDYSKAIGTLYAFEYTAREKVSILEEYCEMYPGSALCFYLLALSAAENKNSLLWKKSALKAYELAPSIPEYRVEAALAFISDGDSKNGKKILEQIPPSSLYSQRALIMGEIALKQQTEQQNRGNIEKNAYNRYKKQFKMLMRK